MNIFYRIIGTLSTICVGIWALVQTINFFIKPKQELRFFCNIINAVEENDKLYYRSDPNAFLNYKLFVETIRQNTNETMISECKNLYIYIIGIKNTGKMIINEDDFYPADRLSLNLTRDVIAISINNKTPKYINATISNFTTQGAIINFDSLEPNDCIYITVISQSKMFNNNLISGKTNSIKKIKALDSKTANEFYGTLNYWEEELLAVKEGLSSILRTNLFGMTLFAIAMFALSVFVVVLTIINVKG